MFTNHAVYDALDAMVADGRIAAYGVSVETCAQALEAIARPHVATVQIILNCFPSEAARAGAAGSRRHRRGDHRAACRSPRACSPAVTTSTRQFAADDHRNFNRRGESFDVGETFAGVPFEVGLRAVAELKRLLGPDQPLAQFALRWVIDQPGVSTVIPGARNPEQARQNAAAAKQPPLSPEQLDGVRDVYDRLVREHVHEKW